MFKIEAYKGNDVVSKKPEIQCLCHFATIILFQREPVCCLACYGKISYQIVTCIRRVIAPEI